MGKSSLAIRIAERLRAEETAVAQLDLTPLGHNLNPEQWYFGLLFSLGEQLALQGELEEFWQSHEDLGPLQRWMQAVHDVVLERCPGPVVLVIDEIDYVRRLPFSTDEFFAAIRACFNRRADDPTMRRLSFCLLGTVTPSELIEDPNTTPFNIGWRIELNDFTEVEAATLARGLGRDEQTAARLMRRIYHWTGGQPYLTQSLCRAVAEAPQVVDATGVDRICQSLFFTGHARATDKNLQFVGGHIVDRENRLRDGLPGGDQPRPGGADELSPEDRRRAGLLDLYVKVHRGRTVSDDETSPLIGALRLSGLVRVVEGTLQVRNRIYRRVFDEAWIQSNVPRTVAQIRREAYLRGVRKATVIAASVLGLAAISAYWVWDTYFHVKTAYYASFVQRDGVYEGVGWLSPEEVRHRMASLKFSSRHGKVVKVEVVNAAGHLTSPDLLPGPSFFSMGDYLSDKRKSDVAADATKACQWEFIRDSEGHVVYEPARDKAGRLVGGLLYVPTDRPTGATAFYIDHNGIPQARSGSGAACVKIGRSEKGFDREIRFFDIKGNPQPNEFGEFGTRFEIDPRTGLIVVCTSLGPDGKRPMLRKDGFAVMRMTYDPRGNLVEARQFDVEGRPTMNDEALSWMCLRYDSWGNLIQREFYDARDRITGGKNGVAWIRTAFDAKRNHIEEVNFGVDGRAVQPKDGYARGTKRYDDRGDLVELACTDTVGRPTKYLNGSAGWVARYDDRGNRIELVNVDEAGRPVRDWDGIVTHKYGYDEQGNEIEEAYFDEQGRPTRHKDGYARWTAKFDERGNQIEQAYFDKDGKPVRHEDGYARLAKKYDERGNLIEIVSLDEAGRPVRDNTGYIGVTKRYDERGKLVEETRWGFDPAAGYARNNIRYDERGNWTEWAYFDEQGRPARYKDGYVRVTARYDERGNQIEQAYFDEQGRPARHEDGYARWTAKYDERGNQTEAAYFDEQGRPTRHKDGYTKLTKEYDDRGNAIEVAYFDEAGKPTLHKDGNATYRAKYDEHGNQIETAYFDREGRPVKNTSGYAKYTATFDDRGNEIERAYFDEADKPARHTDGNTKWTRRYDQSGKRIEDTYWGYDGSKGFAKMVVKFNDKGLGVEYTYFDAADKPIRHKDGNTKMTKRYDESGKPVEDTYWGYDGSNGFAKMVVKLNDKGLGVEYRYFDAADKPARHKAGYARFTARYDERGNRTEEAYFDEAGRPVQATFINYGIAPVFRCTRMTQEYNDRGRLIRTTFWDCDDGRGFAKIVYFRDDQERITEECYLDSKDQPVLNSDLGYAKTVVEYDDKGVMLIVTHYGIDGDRVPTRPMAAEIVPGGQAKAIGLEPGDTILSYDGKAGLNLATFIRAVQVPGEGSRELRILRRGEVLTFQVQPGKLGIRLVDRAMQGEKTPSP